MNFFLVFFSFLLVKPKYSSKNIILLSNQKEFEKGENKTKIMELIERIKEKKWRDYIEMEEY